GARRHCLGGRNRCRGAGHQHAGAALAGGLHGPRDGPHRLDLRQPAGLLRPGRGPDRGTAAGLAAGGPPGPGVGVLTLASRHGRDALSCRMDTVAAGFWGAFFGMATLMVALSLAAYLRLHKRVAIM